MNQQNQSQAFASLFAGLSTPLSAVVLHVLLVLAGWLVSATPSSASPLPPNPQRGPRVPPPINFAKEKLPSPSFTPRELDFQAPVASPPNTNSEKYLVYVNEASLLRLQQVRTLEPTAFVRQYKGRSVIQSGIFTKNSNAQQQAKALRSKGIEARIVSLATGEETEFAVNSKSYFVVIPASQENLPLIENQVRQLQIDIPVSISKKEQPRGPHVRVGPFSERGQAERLNRYMLNSGLRNARVYYGR